MATFFQAFDAPSPSANWPEGNAGAALSPTDAAIGLTGSPFIRACAWTGAGWGSTYSNPGTLPGRTFDDIAFSHAGTDIALAGADAGATQTYIYPFVPGSGFGAKYSDPGVAPSMNPKGVCFSPDDTVVVMGGGSSAANAINAYHFTHGSGFGAKFSNPGVAPPTLTNAGPVTFAPNQLAVFLGYQGSATARAISGWPWSGAGFGVKYTDPASLFSNSRSGKIAVSPASDAVVIGYMNGSGSNWVSAWVFDATTGFGASLTVPSDLSGLTEVNSAVFIPDGTAVLLAIRQASTPAELRLYSWTAGVGLAASATLTDTQAQHPFRIQLQPMSGGPAGSQYLVAAMCQSQTQSQSPFTFSASGLIGVPLGINPAPTQTVVTPHHGVVTGGTPVFITGTGFIATPTVTFGGVPATSVVWISSTVLSCVTPVHAAGSVNVVVTNPDAQACTLPLSYQYTPTPTPQNIYSSPPWQTVAQWAIHQFDILPRREGPTGGKS